MRSRVTAQSFPASSTRLTGTCPSSLGVDAMTAFDIAYLKGLYSVNSEDNLEIQKRKIINCIVCEAGPR